MVGDIKKWNKSSNELELFCIARNMVKQLVFCKAMQF